MRSVAWSSFCVLVPCLALACATESGAETGTGTTPTSTQSTSESASGTETSTSEATSNSTSTSDSETETDTDPESETSGFKFDMAGLDLEQQDDVCQYVDALFAVDVSGSMTDEIGAMADAMLFASFKDTLLDAGNGLVDFQLAIMDDQPAFPYYHDNTGQPSFDACNFSTDTNFMSSLSPDFEDEFACIFSAAQEGFVTVGDYQGPDADTPLPGLDYLQNASEMPARSAALSVSEPLAQQVNAGFVREDAVLFVMTISDEDDEVFVDGMLEKNPPMEDVIEQMTDIHDRLLAAKGGDPAKVVFLGIGAGSEGCVGPYGETIREAEHIKYLASLFEADGQGLFWDLCEGNLEDAILEALVIVDEACDEWVPVG